MQLTKTKAEIPNGVNPELVKPVEIKKKNSSDVPTGALDYLLTKQNDQ